MCGIVGIGNTQTAVTPTLVKWFESLLLHDIVRGPHATGVYRGYDGGVSLYKDAIPASLYLHTDGWNALRGEDLTAYQVGQLQLKGDEVPAPLSNFYVGHNRYATMGNSADPKGAHPFHEGSITLVHNGTLTGQWRLPDNTNFKVDSNNIAHSIDKIGIAETVSKLQGAYTLVWHDQETQTLNFLRNEQRPLFMVEFQSGAWMWCSEGEMFEWLNTRRRVPHVIKQSFELPVGFQMIFDVSDGKFVRQPDVKHTMPNFTVARSTYNGGTSLPHYSGSTRGSSTSVGKPKNVNGNLRIEEKKEGSGNVLRSLDDLVKTISSDLGVRGVGYLTRVPLTPYDFLSYEDDSKLGRIRGYGISETGSYYEAEVHGFTEEDFDKIKGNEIFGVVRSAMKESYEVSLDGETSKRYQLVLILGEVSYTLEGLSSVDKDLPKIADVETGVITSDELESIQDEEIADAVDALTTAMDNIRKQRKGLRLAEVKVLKDGSTVTEDDWDAHEMSVCSVCGINHPWSIAEDVSRIGGLPTCDVCCDALLHFE